MQSVEILRIFFFYESGITHMEETEKSHRVIRLMFGVKNGCNFIKAAAFRQMQVFLAPFSSPFTF